MRRKAGVKKKGLVNNVTLTEALSSITIPALTPEQLANIASQVPQTDISGKVDKVTGKGLSTNDLTDLLKTGYDGAVAHAGSAHAPSNAQKNSDITGAEIEAKLTGVITTHSHSAGGLTQSQIRRLC
jgi:hypothetical protein